MNLIYPIQSEGMVRLTATEVARQFSSVVNRVSDGEEIEVIRNGVPIVQMRPALRGQLLSAVRWRELMDTAPPVDEDFERDVLEGRESIGPPSAAWPS